MARKFCKHYRGMHDIVHDYDRESKFERMAAHAVDEVRDAIREIREGTK